MSDFDGNFMEMMSYWAQPSSPSPRTILARLDLTDDGMNRINEIFPQTNLPRDHIHQSEQRSGLGERLAARSGFSVPTLDTENISPLAALFKSSTDPSHVVAISPGFSPSILLQSPNMVNDSSQVIPPSSAPNDGPPEMVETSGGGNATTMIFNNNLPYQTMNVDLPPLEGFDGIPTEGPVYNTSYETHVEQISAPLVPSFESELADDANVNIISTENSESDNENEDDELFEYEEEEDDVEEVDHDGFADLDDAEPSSPKRRKFEVSNMIGATRSSKTQRIILQMESDEDHPEDGFRWRKYGQKVVKGNPNPRSYYKCTSIACNVKKHVERGADDVNLVVTTYDGIHNHPAPPARSRNNSGSRNRSDTTMSENHSNRTSQLGVPPPPSYVTPMEMRPLSSFTPQVDLTRVYMTGLSKLPTIPVYQNPGFMYRTDKPRMNVVPDVSGVYGSIMHRLSADFGMNL